MKVLKIITIALILVAVASVAGCSGKAHIIENKTQEASEKTINETITPVVTPTSSVTSTSSATNTSMKDMSSTSTANPNSSSSVVDVVCKMKIDKNTAEFTSEYKGITYYFCALSCKKEFDKDPEKYVNSENTEKEDQEASEQVIPAEMTDADSALSTVTDVVCKMQIDKRTAEFTSEYKGTTYYFCALSCKKEFDKDPEKYVNSKDIEKENMAASRSC